MSNREACRFVGAEIGKSETTVRQAVRRVQGSVDTNVAIVPNKQNHEIVEKVHSAKGTTQKDAIALVAAESGKTEAAVKKIVQREQKKYAEKQTLSLL